MNVSEKVLRGLFEEFGKNLKQEIIFELKGGFAQMIEDNSRIVVDLLRQEIRATENRLVRRMDDMRDEIVDVIDQGVLPQIDGLDRRVTRIEKWAKI